jgi:hypothetical protein
LGLAARIVPQAIFRLNRQNSSLLTSKIDLHVAAGKTSGPAFRTTPGTVPGTVPRAIREASLSANCK